MNIFITGNSSGIGLGLTNYYLAKGDHVWGCSRRGCPIEHENLHDAKIDLCDFDKLGSALDRCEFPDDGFELIVLNAGKLGDLKDMSASSLDDLESIMNTNVWANKLLIDELLTRQLCTDQIIAISSGAAVNGSRGWAGYSISKAALNMMILLYSRENEHLHFTAFAPGLVDTPMQDYIYNLEMTDELQAMQRLKDARYTDAMPDPDTWAQRFDESLEKLKIFPSGSFLDIRKL